MAVLGSGGSFRDARQWYVNIARLECQTCLVEANGNVGTGFLVGPDLLLTAHHVIFPAFPGHPERESSPIVARFDYRVSDVTGQIMTANATRWRTTP